MEYYLVRTAYGTELLWCGSTGPQACRNAEAVVGVPVVAWREVHPETSEAA